MLPLLAALLVRVQVLGLLHPHVAVISTPRGEMRVRAVGDTLHEGVAPPLPFLTFAAPNARQKPLAIKLDKLPRRSFSGALELRAKAGELIFFNQVPLEEYVASVVGAEMPGDARKAPPEAQKALAVVARSFALHAISRGDALPESPSHDGAPLCDSTHCQLYGGLATASKSARAAARATAGLVLLLPSGKVAPALHHAACGGRTSTAREVWPGASDDDELASAAIDDKLPDGSPACAPLKGDPPLEWHAALDEQTVARALGTSPPLSLSIERGPDGRVKSLSANGARPLGADELHLALGRALGWNLIRSSRIYWTDANALESNYDLPKLAHSEVSAGPIRFAVRGSGFGHGVGLCQRGAARWARNGETFRRILSRYFPKLSVGRLPMTPVPG